MKLVSNSVEPNSVREETRDGDRYLVVEDVPFVRAMDLAGGYVPEREIRSNTDRWDGRLLTVRHPTNDPNKPWFKPNHPTYGSGDYVPVDFDPQIREQLVIGEAESPRYDGTHSRVDMAINADKATRLGGHAADIVSKIENGEAFNVSSQYAPKPLQPGMYDGAYRANVEGIDRPDSIALLPHGPGQCSLERGECGINPNPAGVTANLRVPMADDGSDPEDSGQARTMRANKSVDGITYQGTEGGDLDEGDIPTDGFESHYVFDGDTKTASSFPLVDADGNLRRGNVAAAFRFREDAPDTDKLLSVLAAVNDEFDDPPIDPDSLDAAMNGDMSSNSWWGFDRMRSFLGIGDTDGSTVDERAESRAEASDTNMSDKTADLVANHGFDADNLPPEDTECFGKIYDAVTSNESAESEDVEDEQTTDEPGEGGEEYVTRDDLDDLKTSIVSEVADQVTANENDSDQEDLAKQIVANSAEYDDTEDVREDYPTMAALEAKRDSLNAGSALPGGGASLSANVNSDEDPDEISSGVF